MISLDFFKTTVCCEERGKYYPLHKEWNLRWRMFTLNMIKTAISWGFGQNYWQILNAKFHFLYSNWEKPTESSCSLCPDIYFLSILAELLLLKRIFSCSKREEKLWRRSKLRTFKKMPFFSHFQLINSFEKNCSQNWQSLSQVNYNAISNGIAKISNCLLKDLNQNCFKKCLLELSCIFKIWLGIKCIVLIYPTDISYDSSLFLNLLDVDRLLE